eukprot:CAMPEP_0194478566 /NCGR_PEP_ID=MMETSP0253-20130528/1968_1 /TAXON_ID=2966 /ORGANISM="Noctiluca scintillans" /LENGTH=504 /DNA_ID=CAMNT_0039317671 /DNA_START=24 /DNA_END=1535 /DNA_ORIENTATION=-
MAFAPTDAPMKPAAMKILLTRPKVPAPLDPNFAPAVLGYRNYLKEVKGGKGTLEWALPRKDGCGRGSLPSFAEDDERVDATVHLAGVLIQQMFWERSASSLLLSGPTKVCEALKAEFSPTGKFAFEVLTMPKVCGTPSVFFEVSIVEASQLPPARDSPQACGQDAKGCRLAFDLGKSDIKTVAVKDNEVLSSKETEWDVTNPDPQYHWDMILNAMKETASFLPKIEAIGGSATGTLGANNEATWCDIFPNVPPDVYQEKVVPIFNNLAKEFGAVPLKVINDGEVTAIAGAMMVGEGNLLGISMGSSEGGGYCNADKNLMGWINEMCYIQLDLNPEAATDPWTKGHTGISHMYLGQRGATKLVEKGGVDVPEELRPDHSNMNTMKHEGHAKCLKLIQAAMKDPAKEPQARKIYETVGVYLGYGLAQYSEHYKIENALILGRVSSGAGGDILIAKAKEVLAIEFPDIPPIKFHFADEHFKRVGQCIAAAALPTLEALSGQDVSNAT